MLGTWFQKFSTIFLRICNYFTTWRNFLPCPCGSCGCSLANAKGFSQSEKNSPFIFSIFLVIYFVLGLFISHINLHQSHSFSYSIIHYISFSFQLGDERQPYLWWWNKMHHVHHITTWNCTLMNVSGPIVDKKKLLRWKTISLSFTFWKWNQIQNTI